MFHVSVFKRYHPDSDHVIEYKPVDFQMDLSYIEHPVEILDRQERVHRNKKVMLVKVLWRNLKVEELTWELEGEML